MVDHILALAVEDGDHSGNESDQVTMELVDGISSDFSPLEWWKLTLPSWLNGVKKVLMI